MSSFYKSAFKNHRPFSTVLKLFALVEHFYRRTATKWSHFSNTTVAFKRVCPTLMQT